MDHRERVAVPQSDYRTGPGSFLMDGPSWRRVKEVLEGTLARPPEEHASFVSRICRDDPEVRAEVESLLAAIEKAGNFMEPGSQLPSPSPLSPPDGFQISASGHWSLVVLSVLLQSSNSSLPAA